MAIMLSTQVEFLPGCPAASHLSRCSNLRQNLSQASSWIDLPSLTLPRRLACLLLASPVVSHFVVLLHLCNNNGTPDFHRPRRSILQEVPPLLLAIVLFA